jgi:hypothetical protein
VDLIYEHLVDLKEDGSFTLNQEYFGYLTGLTMTGEYLVEEGLIVKNPGTDQAIVATCGACGRRSFGRVIGSSRDVGPGRRGLPC